MGAKEETEGVCCLGRGQGLLEGGELWLGGLGMGALCFERGSKRAQGSGA